MCNLSHRASMLTSVKMLIAARVFCSTGSKRISTMGTVMFIRSVFLPQGFLEFHSSLHRWPCNCRGDIWPWRVSGIYQGRLSECYVFQRRKEGPRQHGLSCPLPPPTCISLCHWVHRRCSSTHPSLAGISRGKKKYLFIPSAPAKRVVPICVENLQVLCAFLWESPHIWRELKNQWDFPALSESVTLVGRQLLIQFCFWKYLFERYCWWSICRVQDLD